MLYALLCTIDSDRLSLFRSLQDDHYDYLQNHRDRILSSGLARLSEGGRPEMMIIIVEAESAPAAEAFIADEPYNSHGGFSSIVIRPWTQMLPEPPQHAAPQG
jgi:uncharacterized protein YciI